MTTLSPPDACTTLVVTTPSDHMQQYPMKPFRKLSGAVRYMECLKNHAAAIGGSATDGCGEFMAGGADGSLEALICSACNCHRNFHRKIHILPQPTPPSGGPAGVMKRSTVAGQKAEVKKRFRTKFSQEQKEKMLRFAEKGGWKLQMMDDSEVASFCQEIGIKRKVLKVWMHNNKDDLLDSGVTQVCAEFLKHESINAKFWTFPLPTLTGGMISNRVS